MWEILILKWFLPPANIPSRIVIISLQQQQQHRSSLTHTILLQPSLEKIHAGNGELLFFLQLHHRRGLSSSHSRESRLWEWHSSPICLQSPQASLSLWCKTACKTVSVVGFCSSIAASGTSWTTPFSSKTCFFFLLTCERVEKSGLAGAWRTHDRKHAARLCVSRQSMEHCLILALSTGDGHPQVWPRESCAGAVVVSSCCSCCCCSSVETSSSEGAAAVLLLLLHQPADACGCSRRSSSFMELEHLLMLLLSRIQLVVSSPRLLLEIELERGLLLLLLSGICVLTIFQAPYLLSLIFSSTLSKLFVWCSLCFVSKLQHFLSSLFGALCVLFQIFNPF